MTLGQYNAYVWWWLVNSHDNTPTGLIDGSNSPTYFGLGIEHFSRLVRPGYVRYDATSSPVSGVYLSAYAGDGHQVIVVINSNASAVTLPIQIRNQTATALTPWQTTSSASVSPLSAIQRERQHVHRHAARREHYHLRAVIQGALTLSPPRPLGSQGSSALLFRSEGFLWRMT
jgi:O-glycosyl hydrolase